MISYFIKSINTDQNYLSLLSIQQNLTWRKTVYQRKFNLQCVERGKKDIAKVEAGAQEKNLWTKAFQINSSLLSEYEMELLTSNNVIQTKFWRNCLFIKKRSYSWFFYFLFALINIEKVFCSWPTVPFFMSIF
jgi:hypothetical protein